jgi:phage shock protein E
MFEFLKKLVGSESADYKQLITDGAIIIDVRTPSEFKSGHADGAINIPLDNLEKNLKKIEDYNQPLIFCCASGMRSGRAVSILKSKGLSDIYNAGSWVNLQ